MFGFLRRKDVDGDGVEDELEDLKRALREKNAEIANLKSRLNVVKFENGTLTSKLSNTIATLNKQNAYVHHVYAKMMGWRTVAEHLDQEIKTNVKKYKNIFLPVMIAFDNGGDGSKAKENVDYDRVGTEKDI